MSEERRHLFVLWHPWEKIDPADRFRALEIAAEIIFPDKSAVTWNGDGWRPNYRRMKKFAGTPDAVNFIFEQFRAWRDAENLLKTAPGSQSPSIGCKRRW